MYSYVRIIGRAEVIIVSFLKVVYPLKYSTNACLRFVLYAYIGIVILSMVRSLETQFFKNIIFELHKFYTQFLTSYMVYEISTDLFSCHNYDHTLQACVMRM